MKQYHSRACRSRTYLWTPYKSVGCNRLTLRPMIRVTHSIVPYATRTLKGESPIALRLQHLIAKQGSHSVIHSTNNSILAIGASTNTQNTTSVELQHVLSTVQRILTLDMTILTQTSKVIRHHLSLS